MSKIQIFQYSSTDFSVRAKNSFNAIIPAAAVVRSDRIVTSDMDGFSKRWNVYCAKKKGRDFKHIRAALRIY